MYFLNEIDPSIHRLSNPELYKKGSTVPTDNKETRELSRLSMSELRDVAQEYWKQLSDAVYNKYKDGDGYYFSATGVYRSKNKLDFQIDHIKPMNPKSGTGGQTELDNLQLLTRQENGLKGAS